MVSMHLDNTAWGWNLEPTILMGCFVLVVGYMAALGFRLTRKSLDFSAGIIVLLLALVSPLDMLSDTYLFSAHMLQHLLLVLVVPPLLLRGIPARLVNKALRVKLLARLEGLLSRPWVAWTIGTVPLYFWHIPLFYDAALNDSNLHIAEHLSFLVTSTIFWWPIVSPLRKRRIRPVFSMAYLFLAMLSSTLLGIVLTFAPVGIYSSYLNPRDSFGLLHLLRIDLGLSPAADQQLGGLMMWIPGNLIYLVGVLTAFSRWFRDSEAEPKVRIDNLQNQPDI